ncbi:Exonuclease [Clostridium cavendishii DSM 21758]|uniref:Exonuclease n=1 Tax=Clostridium cavendishii DSM 21758 TaxID=1121302 RepID=A0A1M6VKU2_9CLOT|nr:3'-5' exonuclease [Clostridium cavendishii]SHK82110.1 Exonuclease [Clostridium cavendishii DSM 21758]
MGYIILDLEFNNMRNITKYYENIYENNPYLKDVKLENEIIEIGAVKLDKFMKNIGEYKAYIKPTIFKVMNPKVEEITGITEEMLEDGLSFKEAMEGVKAFVGEGDIICSWAKDDIAEIIENANLHEYTDINWLKDYLDIQEYCTKILAHKKSLSLKNALEELKIRVDEDKLHDALNDAVYTAEVFKRLYNSRIVKNYIVKDIYNMPAIMVKDLENYEIDDEKLDFKCPKCKTKFNVEQPLKLFNWRFMAIGKCPKCKAKILHELIIKKTISGDVVYNNLKTILSDIEYVDYSYKLEKQ